VNDSLKTAAFNKGTHLVIETLDRSDIAGPGICCRVVLRDEYAIAYR